MPVRRDNSNRFETSLRYCKLDRWSSGYFVQPKQAFVRLHLRHFSFRGKDMYLLMNRTEYERTVSVIFVCASHSYSRIYSRFISRSQHERGYTLSPSGVDIHLIPSICFALMLKRVFKVSFMRAWIVTRYLFRESRLVPQLLHSLNSEAHYLPRNWSSRETQLILHLNS